MKLKAKRLPVKKVKNLVVFWFDGLLGYASLRGLKLRHNMQMCFEGLAAQTRIAVVCSSKEQVAFMRDMPFIDLVYSCKSPEDIVFPKRYSLWVTW